LVRRFDAVASFSIATILGRSQKSRYAAIAHFFLFIGFRDANSTRSTRRTQPCSARKDVRAAILREADVHHGVYIWRLLMAERTPT